jgi:isopenicillin N synthase-like dioxygenase
MEAPEERGTWLPVSGDATVLLCGWFAIVLSGSKVAVVRHRVRRVPRVRRLSAVLFVAPDMNVKLAPAERVEAFSDAVNEGASTYWFKEIMGKRWRHREGNDKLEIGDDRIEQDIDIERLIGR